MDATAVDPGAKKGVLGKIRVAVAVILCLPLLLTTIGSTTLRFAGGRVLSESAFASYTAQALADAAVDDAIGQVVGDKVLDVLDENHQKPEKVRTAIKDAAATVLGTEEARTIAAGIFAKAHSDFISTAERDDLTGKETMAVNFTPLVYRAFVAVADAKVVKFRSALPAVDTLADDAAMLAAISKAIGHDVGEKAGSVRVIDQKEDGSDTAFKNVHDGLSAYHDGVTATTVAMVLLVLAVVLLFVRRRIGVIVASSVILFACFVPWVVLGSIPAAVEDGIDNERGRAVAMAFVNPLTGDVRTRLILVMVVALVGILVGSFWTRIRGLVAKNG